jgi:hypothetical protein
MIFRNKRRMREYWKRVMESTRKKISEGASQIWRIMPYARKENWRHKDEKK